MYQYSGPVFSSIHFRSNENEEKYFCAHQRFRLFSPVHRNEFSYKTAYFLMRFRRLSSTLKRTVFKSLRFYLSTLEMGCFQNAPLLRLFLKPSVCMRFYTKTRRNKHVLGAPCCVLWSILFFFSQKIKLLQAKIIELKKAFQRELVRLFVYMIPSLW